MKKYLVVILVFFVLLSNLFLWLKVSEFINTLHSRIQSVELAYDNVYMQQSVLLRQNDKLINSIESGDYFIAPHEKISYNDADVFCLAKNIYHEARGEPILGQYAVAQVTINRKRHSNYPNTICEVVLQAYQFSWTLDSSIRWAVPSETRAWNKSLNIAKAVLENNVRVNGLEQALFFHTLSISPSWRDPDHVAMIVGDHIFYTRSLIR